MRQPKTIPSGRLKTASLPHQPEGKQQPKKSLRNAKNYSSLIQALKPTLKAGRQSAMPDPFLPMEAGHTRPPFTDQNWLFEQHFNGTRALAFLQNLNGAVNTKLVSASQQNLNASFPTLYQALVKWPVNAVVDGEIISLTRKDEQQPEEENLFIYYVFDLLWLEGHDLSELPLLQRKEMLMQLVPDAGPIRMKDHIETFGEAFYYITEGNGFGMMARKKNSFYYAGATSADWLLMNDMMIQSPKAAETPEGPEESDEKTSDQADKLEQIELDGRLIKLHRLQHLVSKKHNLSKNDIIRYLLKMGEVMLPYMNNRPQQVSEKTAIALLKHEKWMRSFEKMENDQLHFYLIPSGLSSLISMADAGCYTWQPWHSTAAHPDRPDWCQISVRSDNGAMDKVMETAALMHQILRSLDIISFPKTSLSGIDIFIPLGGKYNYQQSAQLAEMLVALLYEELPELALKKKRSAVKVEHHNNMAGATAPAPYALLTKTEPTICAPLFWEEVKPGLKPADFTLLNMHDRLQTTGDPFRGIFTKAIELNQVLKGLSMLMAV